MNRRQFLFAGASGGAVALAGASFAAPSVSADIALNGALAFVVLDLPGGAQGSFLIDTGAEATVVDPALLARSQSETSRVLRLGIGAFTRSVRPALRDLKPVSNALKQPVDGLLGNDFFAGSNVALSYSQRRLSLGPSVPRPASGLAMRFDGMPNVRAAVRHGDRVLDGAFGLDTGLDTGAKLVASKASAAFPALAIRPGSGLTMEGLKPQELATLDFIRAGAWDIAGPTVNLSDDPAPKGAGADYAGTLGAPLFLKRVLTLDYSGGWWSLSPEIL